MNLICRKNSLLEALNTTSKAAANRSTLPVLECLLLTADGDGIYMIGNDLQIGIRYNNINGEIIEEGTVALEAKILFDIVRRLPGEEVLIKTDTNQIAVIQSGKSEFKILGLPGEEFPQLLIEADRSKIKPFVFSASLLRDMLKKTFFSIALESTNIAFTGELFDIEDGVMNLVSSDTYRISQSSSPIPDRDLRLNLIVPGKALNELLKILPGEEETQVYIYVTDKHILFEFGHCVLEARLINGDFIKYRHSFEVDATTTVKADRELLCMSLERASLISTKEAKKNPIKMNISSDVMVITTNTEMGSSYEEVNVVTEGEPLEIAFNPKYLMDTLKAMDEPEVILYFTTPLSPVIIKAEGKETYRYLILPLRLRN